MASSPVKIARMLEEMNKEPRKSDEAVEHPVHYKFGGIETLDYIEAKELGFNLGNAVKYVSRAGKKDKTKEIEDLKKAVFYINRQISNLEKQKK